MKVVYVGADEGAEGVQGAFGESVELMHIPAESEALTHALQNAVVLIDASMRVAITREMLQGSALKVIACPTTGTDHIDRDAALDLNIAVWSLKDDPKFLLNITPAAELSWALLMASARRLVPAMEHVRSGRWVREDFPGLMLKGRTLGLIGFGRLGQWMARYGEAFGMSVIAFDPFLEPWPSGATRMSEIEHVARQADFVSVHVHLSDATRGLVSAAFIAKMKKGAVLINTSRGALVDEAALLRALESGQLAAAGLDVLDGEPDTANHPLVAYAREHDNLLITPHCGGFSPDAVRVVCRRAADAAFAHLRPVS
jgi:phosphoglycerate dehydrogenase-like enzyme